MSAPVVEILIEGGRLVGGHPMVHRVQMDDKTKQPKTQADGVTPLTEAYVGVAVPKTAGLDWKQTPWGMQIVQAATSGFLNGEHARLDFAWKVTDGDSTVPNKKNKKPCDKEGFPGHWVINCSTGLLVKCYHSGKYDPTQQIQDKAEIKAGDYCRVSLNAKANGSETSPGVYLNPTLFELSRPGVEIQLDSGPDAAAVFGQPGAGGAGGPAPIAPLGTTGPAVPGGPSGPSGPSGPVGPANDFLNGPEKFQANDGQWTREELMAAGYTPDQIETLPKVPATTQAAPEPKYQTKDGQWTRAELIKVGYNDAQIDALPTV